MITFESDQNKEAVNHKTHGVSFQDAQSVLYDDFAIQFFDEEHSTQEQRFLMLGMSTGARLLLICHCEQVNGDIIRIISARKATKKEKESKFYKGEEP